MYDAAGGLLYVGKARNLRRRLAQYRTARRTKKDRKRRVLVRSADRIEWQACASELEASLTEIGLIQALRPRRNVAGAFPFLYPFIGIQVDGADTYFCLTTSPEAFAAFELHGAFRSREVTCEAFFALMRLLRFVGHPTARRPRDRLRLPRHSHVSTFRRLPRDWPALWNALLRGASRVALEQLSLRLLEYEGACARSAAIHADLRAVERFFDDEASMLAKGHNFKPHLLFTWVDEIVHHPAIVDAVEDVIGPDIRLFHLSVWPKNAGDAAYVSWHQDATYFGLEPPVEVTAWVALTDASIEAGCMEVVPGSHTLGQLHHGEHIEATHNLRSRGQAIAFDLDETSTEF